MSQIITSQETPYDPPPPEEDEFRYGWRYVTRTLPDGTETDDEVPLTLEDRLFPEEGDRTPDTMNHYEDRVYCSQSLAGYYRGDLTVAVLSDQRVDFNVAKIRPMGPDVIVLFEVRVPLEETAGTFEVAKNGGRPVLVIEIGSPSTWIIDIQRKPDLYYQIGIEKFVFVDRGPSGFSPAVLYCYQRGPAGWVEMVPDGNGCFDLAPVCLRIGLENDHPRLFDARTGDRILNHAETHEAMRLAQAKAKEYAMIAKEDKDKTKEDKDKTREAKAKTKEYRARTREAKARAKEEAKRNAALEERLRELEEQLRPQQGTE